MKLGIVMMNKLILNQVKEALKEEAVIDLILETLNHPRIKDYLYQISRDLIDNMRCGNPKGTCNCGGIHED